MDTNTNAKKANLNLIGHFLLKVDTKITGVNSFKI